MVSDSEVDLGCMIYVDGDSDCENLAAALADALHCTLTESQVISLPESQW